MSCLKRYTSTVSTICLIAVLGCVAPALADGDPAEAAIREIDTKTTVVEVSNELRPDEQAAPADEAVATVTADGDFLLPTYLLPGETANVERTTTIEKVYEDPAVRKTQNQVVEQKKVVEQKQDVMTETSKKIVQQDDELEELLRQTVADKHIGSGFKSAHQAETSKKILIPLAPLPEVEKAEPTLPPHERSIVHGDYANQMVGSLKSGEPMAFKMPHELKIIFYPKASAFSGQTLKWVKGFALAALEDPRLVVEVRASCAEARLQADRLKLVKDALKGAGLSTHQIVVNYTNRPVDTMLLRAVPRVEAEELVMTQKDQKLPKNMSQVRKW